MNQRSVERATLFAGLLIAAGLTVWGTASAADDGEGSSNGPCKAKTFNFAVVAQACKAGGAKGRDKVKDIMRAAREKAKAKGIKINDSAVKCLSCHKDQKAYELTSNAVADLRKLLDDPSPVTPKKKH